ncbi:MAG: 2-succinyl-5-enolpyruvyl-6-hydroxy-3-cyclohexene-1-carboxylic-acid synthase, partial [Nannocystaceae bacterium]
ATVAEATIAALVDGGVREIVVSPGSRNTPLVLAIDQHPDLRAHVVVDERTAGFFALGLARASHAPVALVCTSGSAGTHYGPAIAEACHSRIPLVVLTADRPARLQTCGAPQTMDQTGLFANHVRARANFEAPTRDADPQVWYRCMSALTTTCMGMFPGPVHANLRFEKPLWSRQPHAPFSARERSQPGLNQPARLDPQTCDAVASRLAKASRGVLVCGPKLGVGDTKTLPRLVARLAKVLGWPVIVEPLAGCSRACEPCPHPELTGEFSEHGKDHEGSEICEPCSHHEGREFQDLGKRRDRNSSEPGSPRLEPPGPEPGQSRQEPDFPAIAHADLLLRTPEFAAMHAPDLVVRIGAMPTSKFVCQWLDAHARSRTILIDEAGQWLDPTKGADTLILGSPAAICEQLATTLAGTGHRPQSTDFRQSWARADKLAATHTQHADDAWWEGAIARTLARTLAAALPPGTTLHIGNSNAVRDLGSYANAQASKLRVVGNRGVNGIDGNVATALGEAVGQPGPTVLVCGDLTLTHDLGALLNEVAGRPINLMIVVINNGGGGIFRQLPIADHPTAFTRYFLAPRTSVLGSLCTSAGIGYRRVTSHAELRASLVHASASGPTVIEALVDGEHSESKRRSLLASLHTQISQQVYPGSSNEMKSSS